MNNILKFAKSQLPKQLTDKMTNKLTDRTNLESKRFSRGFTIFELMVVLVISAAIGIQVLPDAALESDQLLVDRVVGNTQLYIDAVYSRCSDLISSKAVTSCWGDVSTHASHYSLDALVANNYLNVDTVSNPFFGSDTNIDDFSSTLIGSTPPDFNSIRISFDVIGADTAQQIASRLPSGTSAPKVDDIYTVTVQLPVPANESAHQLLLRTDGTNPMTGNLDVGGHEVTNARSLRATEAGMPVCNMDAASLFREGLGIPDFGTCPTVILTDPLIGFKADALLDSFQIQIVGDLEVGNDVRIFNDLAAAGDVTAGAYYYDSDIRLKTNMTDITQGQMDLLLQLATVSYNKKDREEQKFGLIAQDVAKKFPGLVIEKDNGMLAVDYQAVIPLLISVLNRQQQLIDDLIKDEQIEIDLGAK